MDNTPSDSLHISDEVYVLGKNFADGIKSAALHPVDQATYQLLDSAATDPIEDTAYQRASVRLFFKDIKKLTQDELAYVREVLEETVRESLSPEISSQVTKYIAKDFPANVLQHEIEHAHAVPEHMQDQVMIDIVFIKDQDIRIDGTTWYPTEQLSLQEQALISATPISLSESDVISALTYAEKSEDSELVARVEDIISTKLRHELQQSI